MEGANLQKHAASPVVTPIALRSSLEEPEPEFANKRESWHNQLVSPTVLQSGPYRLFFFSSDRGEPVHIHVARDKKAVKFWLAPVRLEYNHGFVANELKKIEGIVRATRRS